MLNKQTHFLVALIRIGLYAMKRSETNQSSVSTCTFDDLDIFTLLRVKLDFFLI